MSKHEEHILQILAKAGTRGITVSALAKHVYNRECSLFDSPDYAAVYQYVRSYIYQHSRQRRPTIEPTGQRGSYRLRESAQQEIAQQLSLWDTNNEEEEDCGATETPSGEDLSLSLFSDDCF